MSVQNNLQKPSGRIESRNIAVVLALLFAVALIAFFVGRGAGSRSTMAVADGETGETSAAAARAEKSPASALISLEAEAVKTAGIKTALVQREVLPNTVTVPGSVLVSPNGAARVTPPVAGKIIALYAVPGDRVQAGQALVLLDSPDVAQAHASVHQAQARVAEARAGVQSAEAGVEQARTRAGSAQAALNRQRALVASGQIAQPSLQAAQNDLTDAEAAQKEAQATLALAEATAKRTQRLFEAQIVARVEREQAQAAETLAQAQAERAQKRVVAAEAALAREQRVFQGGLLNRQVVQTAEAEWRAAQGEVRQAGKLAQAARTMLAGAVSGREAALANLRTVEGNGHAQGDAGRIVLYAPLTGVVATRTASVGQAVERSTELFRLQNTTSVLVEASLPEAKIGSVRAGASVQVTVAAYPGMSFAGVVESVGSEVDEKTRALPVRCRVPNPKGQLRPGLFAQVALETGKAGAALTVPDAAVDEDGDKRFVYVAKAGGYEKRAVETGRRAKESVEIVSGVQAEEKVVTDGMFVVKSESKKSELAEED